MDLQKKLKLALNDNRLLILGTQVLFGFQFNGIFQELFVDLPYPSRVLEACGLTLLMISIGFGRAFHESSSCRGRPGQHARIETGQRFCRLRFAVAHIRACVRYVCRGRMDARSRHGNRHRGDIFPCGVFSWYALGFVLRSEKPAMAKDKTVRGGEYNAAAAWKQVNQHGTERQREIKTWFRQHEN